MFQIMFKSGHALLLSKLRFSWPRIGRGGGAERLCNMDCSWPQTRPGHGHDPAQCRTRTQTVRVREQSASASCPRQQSRSHSVRKLGRQWIQLSMNPPRQRSWIVRKQSAVANFPRMRIVHGHDLSAVAGWQRIVPVPASPRPHRRQPVSQFIFKPFHFMITFDPAEVRKAVTEFTPRRPQKLQVVEKSLAAVTNARFAAVRRASRSSNRSIWITP